MEGVIPPEVLLDAYAHGVFPMADEGEILWFEPRMRGLIPLDGRFHVPRRLVRRMKRCPFEIGWDRDFEGVMRGCAERQETWIDETIVRSYLELHRLGCAHSVECRDRDGLQGGFTDASKVALVEMVGRLRARGFRLFDVQWLTPHLQQFGGYEVGRDKYLELLADALEEGPAEPFHQAEEDGRSGSSSGL
jgi:leucyl/phenylalanyl-tRNA--protein transferase